MSSVLGENKMRIKIIFNIVRGKRGYIFSKYWNIEVGDEWFGFIVNKKGFYINVFFYIFLFFGDKFYNG